MRVDFVGQSFPVLPFLPHTSSLIPQAFPAKSIFTPSTNFARRLAAFPLAGARSRSASRFRQF